MDTFDHSKRGTPYIVVRLYHLLAKTIQGRTRRGDLEERQIERRCNLSKQDSLFIHSALQCVASDVAAAAAAHQKEIVHHAAF